MDKHLIEDINNTNINDDYLRMWFNYLERMNGDRYFMELSTDDLSIAAPKSSLLSLDDGALKVVVKALQDYYNKKLDRDMKELAESLKDIGGE